MEWNKEKVAASTQLPVDFLIKVARQFAGQKEEFTGKLRVCIEAGDMEGIGRIAHELTGAAAMLHIEAIREIAESLRNGAKNNISKGDLSQKVDILDEAFSDISNIIGS